MNDPHDPATDPVDEALASGPYVDDGGFTARVLDGLPAPRRRRGRAFVPLFALAACGLGLALAAGPGAGLLAALGAWLTGGTASFGAVPAAALGAIVALAATGLLVAFAD